MVKKKFGKTFSLDLDVIQQIDSRPDINFSQTVNKYLKEYLRLLKRHPLKGKEEDPI